MGNDVKPYFRRDQSSGVTAPDLAKSVTIAEHIVNARGKRTQFTSVSLDATRIRIFGDTTYKLKRPEVDEAGHTVIEHTVVVADLEEVVRTQDKADRARAISALQRARSRQEGLVQWRFNHSGVERKDLMTWSESRVQAFFSRV